MKKVIPEDAVLVPDTATKAFEGMIFDVYQWPQKLFDGSEHTFEMLKRTDTVTAICVVDGKILVIDDEQPHLGSRKSFPGGRVDPEDASPLAAAQREVQEETGYEFQSWRLIKAWQPFRKVEWFVHLYLAWDVSGQVSPKLDPGEKIEVDGLSFDELKTLVMNDTDYLGESRDIFGQANSLQDLLELPEFVGKEVDR
jgi:8-oxo-dGTP pyrophosphatase MutT (NUDIX family)